MSIRFLYFVRNPLILAVSVFLIRCGGIREVWFERSSPVSETYTNQIFFAAKPFLSSGYEPSSFQARYVFLKNRSGKEEMVQGILKYLELSETSGRTEKNLVFVSEWKGNFRRDTQEKHKIEFEPKFVLKRLEISENGNLPEIREPIPKTESIQSLKKVFALDEEGALREVEEIRFVPGIGTLRWKHGLRGIIVKVMQTEFVNAKGDSRSARDYDYESMEYPASKFLTGSAPVLPLRKSDTTADYYCLDYPDETELISSKKKGLKKSVSFYDLIANKPFTATVDFKNYPIIRISNEKN
ncbi:hypothetical protein EHQ12_08510 [Leptospira gomenensis]|uniref:Lipoprotein n=1 Tax=Leptospira gomenensis TaxID=2484974 RepID=A0A5F1YDD1_9LEPT|nr:hypothetical protein EHQ17_04780 [Leptospira gomenensis]TGK40086.1 hypothetical protein EHQ12_08510 [Leptospira gomenensis]TGK51561.1 hypothetical protein EHQ07_02905 [Leptospira gomenensis]TGK68114.1 hypothetical protein EHQ13_01435 [Leptospira gomenensis]